MKHFTLCVLLACTAQLLSAQFIERQSFPSVAETVSVNGDEISFSFAQSVIPTLDGTKFTITQGFHQISTSTTVNTNDFISTENFDIFPNPSNGKFQIELELEEKISGSLQVRNILGQLVASHPFTQISELRKAFNLDGQTAGVYTIQLLSDHKKIVLSQKIIIQD